MSATPPTELMIEEAEQAARRAFQKWQRLRYFHAVQEQNETELKTLMFNRLSRLALTEASRSIKRIQAVLGVANLVGQKTSASPVKLFGQPLLRGTGIVRMLAEPLVSTSTPLADESPPTPS